ncbi:PLDc N-terminal domain-containing protein [Microbacterium sp. SLBN-146]|uniref:PLDc N-terminal domain-containing protein n=1 Tax=Microbacterium sp. SLBN-146 TaxID=2768457 RepID=UPI001153C8CD|nr:PLDc N-terminal domain-containing protein [Microbacterium sp. SLBN-146]TQJ30153.1 phospholipase D-like protein [Microbacterium sp. SLBN-146]
MGPNPLLPAGYDIVWSVVSFAILALVVVALVSISRSAKLLTSTQALTWTLVAIFVPMLGPIAWLAIGRRAARLSSSPVAASDASD